MLAVGPVVCRDGRYVPAPLAIPSSIAVGLLGRGTVAGLGYLGFVVGLRHLGAHGGGFGRLLGVLGCHSPLRPTTGTAEVVADLIRVARADLHGESSDKLEFMVIGL